MKKFLFFICILLLTGCDITYNLDIDDDFVENISMIEDNSANFSYVIGGTDLISFKNYYVSDFIPIHYNDIYYPESHVKVDGVTYYNKEDLSGYNKIMVNLNGAFDSIDSLSNSNAIWKGCSNINISKDDDIVIRASGFKVFDDYKIVDTLSVNIKTKYNVTEHNADKVSDDTYTWLITRDNYLNKRIQITMNEKNDTFFDDPMVKFGLILFIIVSIIGFIILLFKRRFSRINRL